MVGDKWWVVNGEWLGG